jgi:hypothetical protein
MQALVTPNDKGRHMKLRSAGFATILALSSSGALADYTRAGTAPVFIDMIYANEWGSPFVTFKTQINPTCGGLGTAGTGLYLYNLQATPNTQLQNNKLAILLAAKMAGKRVILDYFYDATQPPGSNWANCYIHGIQMTDQ